MYLEDYLINMRRVIRYAYQNRRRLYYASPQDVLAIAEQHPLLDEKVSMSRFVVVSLRKAKLLERPVYSAICWVDSSRMVIVRAAGQGWAKAWIAFRVRVSV